MKRVMLSIIALLCMCSGVRAEYPTVSAAVTESGSVLTYSYTLTNTTADDIWSFAVVMPSGGVSAISSYGTTRSGWKVMTRQTAFDMVSWSWNGASVVSPTQNAQFYFTTGVAVPITYAYHAPGSSSNWHWMYGVPGGGTGSDGNTVLPVPDPVPEPSAFLALAGGLGALGLPLIRRRKTS